MQKIKQVLSASFGILALTIPAMIYGSVYGTVNADLLNVRESESTETQVIQKINKNDEVKVLAFKESGWAHIELNENVSGYVKAEFLNINKVEAEVVANGLNVRSYPSTEGTKILYQCYENEVLNVHYQVEDWYYVTKEGSGGFVHKDFIVSEDLHRLPSKTIDEVEVVEEATAKSSEMLGSNNSLGEQIVSDAMQFLGNPYVYGGNSLTNGVDCSGFVQQIMKRHGINVQRASRYQYSSDGYSISSDELMAGDLVFYGYDGYVSHVGIYIGNGEIIHANTESTGIIISPLFPSGGKPYIGAKRVI